jgi:hypothetical protein
VAPLAASNPGHTGQRGRGYDGAPEDVDVSTRPRGRGGGSIHLRSSVIVMAPRVHGDAGGDGAGYEQRPELHGDPTA